MTTEKILGHTLYGSGDEKVIALHDWMGDSSNWKGYTPYLDQDNYTYAFVDIRGYGSSIDTEGQYTSSEITQDIFTLASHLGWKNFHLIGHSMTAMAAQRMLIHDSKSRIKGLVLISPVPASGFPVDPETQKFFEQIITSADTAASAYGAFTSSKLSERWQLERANRLHKKTANNAMHGYLNMWLTENFQEEVMGNEKPMMILYGEQDHPGFQKEALSTNFSHYPNITFEAITNAGHYAMQQVPIYTATLIEKYLKQYS